MSVARVVLWVVTLAALAVCLRAFVIDVVPGIFASYLLGLLLTVYLLGLINPRWEMFGPLAALPACHAPADVHVWCQLSDLQQVESFGRLLELGRALGICVLPMLACTRGVSIAPGLGAALVPHLTQPECHVTLVLPRYLQWLCLLNASFTARWLERQRLALLQLGARLACIVVPPRFAPSGCFVAAKKVGLGVVALGLSRTPRKGEAELGEIYTVSLAQPPQLELEAWLHSLTQPSGEGVAASPPPTLDI